MPNPPESPGAPLEGKRPGGEMRSAASAAPTRSQILPFTGDLQELFSKPYFIPGLVGCLVVAMLWAFLDDRNAVFTVTYRRVPVGVPLYTMVLAACICVGGAFALYRMAGKVKAWWVMPAAAAFTGVICMSPIMWTLQSVFDIGTDAGFKDSVPVKFFKMFFAAGLPEESLKAIPVLIGVAIGMHLIKTQRMGDGPLRQLAVFEPLDGIIIGTAAGFGFAFAETMFQYVPRTMVENLPVLVSLVDKATTLKLAVAPKLQVLLLTVITGKIGLMPAIQASYQALADAIGHDRAAVELQRILVGHRGDGLQLMIPRLLANLFGHAAYAGVFGYFIGLAALKPQQRLKTLLTGLVLASLLHAMWNSMAGASSVLAFVAAAVAFSLLSICIIKARKISPDRSQLVASQIIDRFARRPAPPAAAGGELAGFAAPGGAQVAARAMPSAPSAPAAPAAPVADPAGPTAAPAASITWDDDSGLRVVEIGSVRIPATVGARVYESHVPGVAAGRGDGVLAEVTARPDDPAVLGLKNLSDRAWTFQAGDKPERELAPGRSIRLEAGMRIRIGTHLVHVR